MAEANFIGVLLDDVRRAHLRHSERDTSSSRRDLVRTVFAAIDGLGWSYREFVRDNLGELGHISPDEELALSEVSYSVTANGKVSRQRKFISTPAAIRLACRIVERVDPTNSFDFSGAGWADFIEAIEVRNRITHPKSIIDLDINNAELIACLDAFYWLMELVTGGMESCVRISRTQIEWTKGLIDDLNAGDPRAWADYVAVEKSLSDRD